MQSIDITYHLNHKNTDDQILYDANRDPTMFEGIGHHEVISINEDNEKFMTCENPYPCDFDRGIIFSMARKIDPGLDVIHLNKDECRKRNKSSCTYKIN